MTDADAIRALATRLFDSIERGDVEAVADCYAPELVVWHNFDGLDQPREDNLKTLAGLIGRIGDRRYEDRRLNVFDGGFVQQHVLTGVRKDGVRVRLAGVLVGAVRDGKIARLDEYLDSAQVAAFRAAV
jgi:ketosteroid isomerase-like protein